MKQFNKWILLFLLFSGCTAAQVQQTLGGYLGTAADKLTTEDVVAGLKEALTNGISNGSASASRVDGFFKNPKIKIPFPPDIQKVETKLRQIGLGDEVDKFVMTLNRSAEEAAKESKPIFVNAIKSMTINDAWDILKGADDAATQYLIKTTSNPLKQKFRPVVDRALEKTNATRYYSDVINAYNKIPMLEDVNADLSDYAVNKALDGLFYLIAQEEKKIREDPVARTTELLKKVFKEQD